MGAHGVKELDVQPIKLNEAALNVAKTLRRGALEPLWMFCIATAIDLPVFSLAFWFALYAAVPSADFDPLNAMVWAVLAGVIFASTMAATGAYRSEVMANFLSFLNRTLVSVLPPAVGIILFAPIESERAAIIALLISLCSAILPTRLGYQIVVRWVIETGLVARRTVIAGGGEEAARLIRGVHARKDSDIRLYGIFDSRDDTRSPTQVLGVPKIGNYDDLIAFVRASEVDLVIIALPFFAEERIKWLLDEFRVLPVEIGLSSYSKNYDFNQNDGAYLKQLSRSFSPECRLTKRMFDIFFATIALVLLWPVMLLAAIALRLESAGPIIFRQLRHGYNDRVVEVFKFRSMYVEATDASAEQVVTKGDPRVTKVGRFLRRSSIDELPQLFNVLKGDLSLVGPRPHAIKAQSSQKDLFTKIVDGYSARHRLPPGITGWAQINGWRGEIDSADKLRERYAHDLYYIENWSMWLDLNILLRTPLSLFKAKGAY